MPTSEDDTQVISQNHLDMEDRIRRRAYELYLDRGGEPGRELEDWLKAERELLGRARQPAQDRATVIGSARNPGRA